jgi:uncharacterized protein
MDSAFLLWAAAGAARESDGRVVALTTTSPSLPARDRADAESFARFLGVDHLWEESRELTQPEYARNDGNRCFHCKTELFRIAGSRAREEGVKWLLYGYNASDPQDDRPGHRAALEAGARTPLADAGLTKAEIGFLMHEAHLPLSGKPASPCLSSRIMTGIGIQPGLLRDVEDLEEILRKAGAAAPRVRVCGGEGGELFLRIEVPPQEMEVVLDCRENLHREGLRRGYRWVTLDLGGYRMGGGVR